MNRIEFLRGLQHRLHDDIGSTHQVVWDVVEALLEDEAAAKRLMGGLAYLKQDLPNKHRDAPRTENGTGARET